MAVLWLSAPDRSGIAVSALPSMLLALQYVANYFFVYWDLDADRLRERRLFRTTEVPWQEVTHIGPWGKTLYLVVEHAREAPMSDRGRVIANPEDRSGFISLVLRYAPQASFDV